MMPNGDPVPTDPVAESSQKSYPTMSQKFTSVKLICLISILFLSTASAGMFYAWGKPGFEWFPQFLLTLGTGAWSGLLVVLGVRIEKIINGNK